MKWELIAEERGPGGLTQYFQDEDENVYASRNCGDLELIGRRVYEGGEDLLVVGDVLIDKATVNGFPPERVPYPKERK